MIPDPGRIRSVTAICVIGVITLGVLLYSVLRDVNPVVIALAGTIITQLITYLQSVQTDSKVDNTHESVKAVETAVNGEKTKAVKMAYERGLYDGANPPRDQDNGA